MTGTRCCYPHGYLLPSSIRIFRRYYVCLTSQWSRYCLHVSYHCYRGVVRERKSFLTSHFARQWKLQRPNKCHLTPDIQEGRMSITERLDFMFPLKTSRGKLQTPMLCWNPRNCLGDVKFWTKGKQFRRLDAIEMAWIFVINSVKMN